MPPSDNLGADHVVACDVGAKRLRADPSLIETSELEFFKEFLTSFGWNGQAPASEDVDLEAEAKAPAANGGAEAAENGHEAASPGVSVAIDETADAKGSGVMDLLGSDDDAPQRSKQRDRECTFGADLEAELRKEHNIAIDDDDGDSERLPRETEAYPLLPDKMQSESVSGAMRKVQAKIKQEALTALEQGNLNKALDKYTKFLRTAGASAEMLLTRANLLLKLRRPLAAVRDCSVALKIDSGLSKAYHTRAICHRKLGHWRRSHRDFSQAEKLGVNESTAMHKYVAKKLGLVPDSKTGGWTKQQVARKVREGKANVETTPDGLQRGTRVQITGLQAKPELNGWLGTVEFLDIASGRYQVRVDGETQSHKFKPANVLSRQQGASSLVDERAEKKQRLVQEKTIRRRAIEKRLKQDGIPDMDASELVEAEMSGMSCDESLCRMVRRLDTDQALEIVWEVQAARVHDKQTLLHEKITQALGDDEDEDHFAEEEPDPERLEEETAPLPPLPDDLEAEPADEQAEERIRVAKQAAAKALEAGDAAAALAQYTKAIELGAGSALLLAKRAELLLTQKRPCAAVRDCTAALEVNPDCGKAFRIRGMAHRRLGHWPEAHSDLAQGQTLDFDDATTAVQAFVAKRAQAHAAREAASRRQGAKRARLG